MGVHDGHRDRLRARFLKEGLEGFEPHTALELLLFYARPRCDTNEIAHALLKQFGSFSAVLDAPLEELEKVQGVGYTSAVLLKMMPAMGAYYLNDRAAPGEILDSTRKAGAYFLPRFLGKTSEELWLVALDDKRKVLRCVMLSDEGIVNAVRVTMRQVVAETMRTNATGVILAHNHPGGVALPSGSDKLFTRQAWQALRHVNVQLLDHLIIANEDFVSLADSGFFDMLKSETY